MKLKRRAVAIPAALVKAIDELVGKHNRRAFVEEIAAREINKMKRSAMSSGVAGSKRKPVE